MSIGQVRCECRHRFHVELRSAPNLDGVPLASQDVTDDLSHLVDESFSAAVLSGRFPDQIDLLDVLIEPAASEPPMVSHIGVRLRATFDGRCAEYHGEFRTGPWARTSQPRLLKLREESRVADAEPTYRVLLALPHTGDGVFELPSLEAPTIVSCTLESLGVRRLESGTLDPQRPVLANQRFVDDAIEACLSAGAQETGGVTLGAVVRLPEPLPGTSTPVITVLTTCLEDRRHTGEVNQWNISQEALVEADRIAELRGLGESVVTVMHTHGFSTECGKCNANEMCPLAECTHVSLRDYQVLEALFPSKATVMPIAGRRLGAEGSRPVLEIHAWQGGQVGPIRWQTYSD